MKNKFDFKLYIINLVVLGIFGFVSFKGTVMGCLTYIITCEMIRMRKD